MGDNFLGQKMAKPDFHFTSIHIIESLGESAREPGKLLKAHLDHISKLADSIPIYFHQAFDCADFMAILDGIYRQQREDAGTPVLHFEVHGGAEGIQLRDGSTLAWDVLAQSLSKFNLATGFCLLVIFACCDGVHQINSLSTKSPSPFRVLVGCEGKIHTHELVDGFGAFYLEIFASGDLLKAVEVLQSRIPSESGKFIFFSAERAFVMAAAKVYSENRNEIALAKRIAAVRPLIEVRRALEGKLAPIPDAELTAAFAEAEKTAMRSFWEIFFCTQRLPGNRKLFDFDDLWKRAADYAEKEKKTLS